MTRNQLRTFCVLLIAFFILLYGAVTAQRAISQSEHNERVIDDKVETLESEIEELKNKTEQLETDLIFRRH